MSIEQQILDHICRPGYKAIKANNLARKLGIKKKKMSQYDQALQSLESRGDIKIGGSGRIRAKETAGQIVGVLKKNSAGAGFVIPHDQPEDVERKSPQGDIFIDRSDVGDAQSGDEVLVRLTNRRRSRGQRVGVIVDVIERATNTFVGTYFIDDGQGYVRIDGKNFNDPIWVGDPGAKGASEDDKVVIEMIRFPTPGQTGEAVLVEVLGAKGDVGVDTLSIIHEFGLPHEFPEEVLKEASLEAENFDDDIADGRDDLTKETIVTIDPDDARDFDDAISLKRTKEGHWLLGVHIADVSHFVQTGTKLDAEARLRGTSVYLPRKVIPMLPEVISNGLASLQENKLRYAKSVFIEFTPEGIPVHTRFASTAIKVKQRFAYEDVMPVVRDPSKAPVRTSKKVASLVKNMHTLAMTLRRRRFSRGSLNLNMPEVKLDFDDDGRLIGAHETEHDESHQMIEEFMLAANIAVAVEYWDRGVPFLRRVHGEPSPAKLKAFAQFVTALGYELKTPKGKQDLQRVLDKAEGEPTEYAVNFALLRSMQQAVYAPDEEGHYALSVEHYCHFTSPIRRYPDLTIHRIFDQIVKGKKGKGATLSKGDLIQLGRHCSTTERRAERAERELIKVKLLTFFEDKVGEEMDALITGVDRFGFFARGTEIPAEGLVHISTLAPNDHFDFEQQTFRLVGRKSGRTFQLGDPVRVVIAHVDVDRRKLDLTLAETDEQTKSPKKSSGQQGKSSSQKKSPSRRKKPAGKGETEQSSPQKKQPKRKPGKKKATKSNRKKSAKSGGHSSKQQTSKRQSNNKNSTTKKSSRKRR